MKLHELRIEGIGPFVGPVSIDFSRFEASGIFLLEGPTGSGKSSIIDAITFALYGDVARLSDASKDRLRSSYCAPSDPSRVECVFEVSSGIYRVTRTPGFFKPGRKTKVNPTVQLERVAEDSDGAFQSVETLSRSHAEADAEITSLIGLKKEQFLQTVVLPQGKFATFLSARSEARRQILQDIFGTHIYQALQEQFRQAANEKATAVEAARSAVIEARAHLNELAVLHGIDLAPTPSPTSEPTQGEAPTDDEALLSRLSAHLQAQGSQLSAALSQAKEALTAAQAAEQRARQNALHLATRDGLVQRLAELDGREEEIAASRLELSNARQAEAARPFIEDFDDSYEVLADAYSTLCAALEALKKNATDIFPLPESLPSITQSWGEELTGTEQSDATQASPIATLRSHNTDNEKQRARLSDLLPLEEGLAARKAHLKDLSQQITDTTSALTQTETLLAELPSRSEKAQASYDEARRIAEGAPNLEEKLDNLRKRLEHAQKADTYEARIPSAKQAVEEAAIAARSADAHARTLREAWMADAASALASDLKDDTPCPVCGSPTHPLPAAPLGEGEAVSHAQVEEADSARQAADRTLHERREALNDLNARAQEAHLSADGSYETLNTAVEATQRDLLKAQQAADSLPALSATIEDLKVEQLHAHTRSLALREQVSADRQQYELLSASIDSDHARCREAAAPFASLRDHDAALACRISSVEETITALTAWERSLTTFTASATRLGQALSCPVPARTYIAALGSQIVGSEDTQPTQEEDLQRAQHAIALSREHLRSAEERSALEDTLEEYQTAVASTQESLKNPAFAALSGDEDRILQACSEQLKAAEEAHTQAVAQHERGAANSDALERAIERFHHASSALGLAIHAAEPARRLHALASATTPENLSRTPLAAWVLMARFEEVLAAANPRLLAISQGRYELIRVDDDGSQSRKSGLGVAVIDHDTETTRLPSTLSGGETFYVSLSLALGLADVVTGENGGVELRTMFIDEGFGSLDATTLDTVMAQLQRLRDSGRTVGVISHVHEMATLIPDQIQVRWNAKEGSRVTIRA